MKGHQCPFSQINTLSMHLSIGDQKGHQNRCWLQSLMPDGTSMVHGLPSMVHGLWSMVYGLIYTVDCGLSTVVCILWSVYCVLSNVCCLLCAVYCVESTVDCLPYTGYTKLLTVYCLLYQRKLLHPDVGNQSIVWWPGPAAATAPRWE